MSGSLLTREQILGNRRQVKETEMKHWGGTLRLRELSAGQLLSLNDYEDLTERNAAMLAMMIVDADNRPVFTRAEFIEACRDLPASGVIEAIKACNDINGRIGEGDAEDRAKKSEASPADSSVSD